MLGLGLNLGLTQRTGAGFTPVTDGMTLTARWDTVGTAYSDMSLVDEMSAKVVATINPSSTGVLMESGGAGSGMMLYAYNGILYMQAGNGSTFGDASNRVEREKFEADRDVLRSEVLGEVKKLEVERDGLMAENKKLTQRSKSLKTQVSNLESKSDVLGSECSDLEGRIETMRDDMRKLLGG